MPTLTGVAAALGAGLGKFADWRNEAGKRKLAAKKLSLAAAESSHKDEAVTYSFLAILLFVGVGLPILTFYGYANDDLHQHVVRSLEQLFEGGFGYAMISVIIAAIGGERITKFAKVWKGVKK